MLLTTLAVSAAPLSPEAALSRALNSTGRHSVKSFGIKNATPALTVKSTSGLTGLYVFATDNEGYLVVSADDCAAPVLGYADSGSFQTDRLAPQMKAWLDFYARQIEWASKKGLATYDSYSATSDTKEPISPMTVSKWNQGAPYNDDCPMDNGERSVTGCVATAMAQAMYFHQWPEKGTGSHSYTWNGKTLSVDFANTTYDWSAMTPTYDDNSTAAAKAAVANLMYSCGVSVGMDYSSDESGASSLSMAQALYTYFGYDKSMASLQRSFYGSSDWNNIVYDQLSQGLPVLYGGQSEEGGHQFICDGYDGNGYFHFNWGWGGVSDGYFLLSALDPLDQGIGGSASDSGFNYDQDILINMKKAQADSKVTPVIYCYGNFGVNSGTDIPTGSEVEFNGTYFNFACADLKCTIGIKLVASDGTVSYLKHNGDYDFPAFKGFESYKVTIPASLAEGTYIVTPVIMPEGDSEWMPVLCPLSGVQSLQMTVENGTVNFNDNITANLQVSNFEILTPIYLDQAFKATFTLTNSGTSEYFGEYLFYLVDSNGDAVAPASDINTVDLLPGDSTAVTYVSKFPSSVSTDEGTETVEPGTYYIAIATHFTGLEIYEDPNPVNVQSQGEAAQLEITSFTIDNGNKVVNTSDVTFNGTVECVEGYFAGQLKVAVFKEDATSTSMAGSTGYVFLNDGESDDFEAHVDISSANAENFFAVVFNGSSQISTSYPFSVSPSGVVTVKENGGIEISFNGSDLTVASPATLQAVRIYDLGGTLLHEFGAGESGEVSYPLSGLGHGQYIVSATDSEGHAAVKTIIR